MDNALTIQLFFFASMIAIALEAYKAQSLARIILWVIAIAFGILGTAWRVLDGQLPTAAQQMSNLATNPLTWFVLCVAVFFILRPNWKRPTLPPLAATSQEIATNESNNAAVRTYVEQKLQNAGERVAQLDRRITKLEASEPLITPTSHKGKPLVRLTTVEMERVSKALLAINDYLTKDFRAFLDPIRNLLQWEMILREKGGAAYHAMVEAPRPTLRQFIDEFAVAMQPFQDELLLLNQDVTSIKTKAIPLWDALQKLSNVSQLLPAEHANGTALELPARQLHEVIDDLQRELDRVQSDIKRWRLKISRGELG